MQWQKLRLKIDNWKEDVEFEGEGREWLQIIKFESEFMFFEF